MTEKKKPSHLLPEPEAPRLRRTMGGLTRSRTALGLLTLPALIAALFGGVGLEVCLSEPMWGKHIWLPSLLIALGLWLLASVLFHTLRMRLFSK